MDAQALIIEKLCEKNEELGYSTAMLFTHKTILRMAKEVAKETVKNAPDYWTGYFDGLRELGKQIEKKGA